jgi:MerR family redox-sensitive transcriptional activator SoxR
VQASLSIGEVSARSGVAPSALRFYEREGLISSKRTDGNQRRYERPVLRRVAFIQAGRAAGSHWARFAPPSMAFLPDAPRAARIGNASRTAGEPTSTLASRPWRLCATA